MNIKISEIISKVVKNLDENEEILREKMEFGYPETSLTDLIADILPEVSVRVIRNASIRDIDEWKELEAEVEWIEPGHGEIDLPRDFLRIVSLRMSDWKRSVSSVVFPDSDNYPLIFTSRTRRYKIRQGPAIALIPSRNSFRLEFIGSKQPDAWLELATYIPNPFGEDMRIENLDDIIWIPRSLLSDIVNETAAEVCRIRK